MQDIESAQALVTRDDIRGGITFRMANMQACAARIGKHIQDVKFRLRGIETFLTGIGRVEELSLFPDGLPFWFELVEWIRFAALVHGKTPDVKPRMDTNEHQFTEERRYSSTVTELVDALRRLGRNCRESSRLFVSIRVDSWLIFWILSNAYAIDCGNAQCA